ncbi:MAG: hypothetical protein GX410_01205 [Elusimicrobia bacterium]|nr:hypothetical protein [Elusimicrobiota bacterium]
MSKTINIGLVPFSCVKLAEADFKDRAAVYVVLCMKDNNEWTVLDAGQSCEVNASADAHPRNAMWKTHCPAGNIWIGTYPMPTAGYSKADRFAMERKLRRQYKPPCGKR